MLVQCFLDRLAEGENVKFTPAAMNCSCGTTGRGNVRELENCIKPRVNTRGPQGD